MYRGLSFQPGQEREISGFIYYDFQTQSYGFTVGLAGPQQDDPSQMTTSSMDGLLVLYDSPTRVLVAEYHTHPLSHNVPILKGGDVGGGDIVGPLSGARVDPSTGQPDTAFVQNRGELDVGAFRRLVAVEMVRRHSMAPVEMYDFLATADGHIGFAGGVFSPLDVASGG
jgi:hypothetical protein